MSLTPTKAASSPASRGLRPTWLRANVNAGLLALAAVFWLAGSLLPATASGAGSSLPEHRFADLIGSGVLSRSVPQWLGVVWYATPLAAGLMVTAGGLRGRGGRALRAAAALIAVVASGVFIALTTRLEPVRFGAGAWCGIAAALLASAAVLTEKTGIKPEEDVDVL